MDVQQAMLPAAARPGIGLRPGGEGTEPPGWQWVWELKPQDADSTDVSLTYDWSAVTDKDLLKKVSFPLVSESELEDSLGRLAAAVSS